MIKKKKEMVARGVGGGRTVQPGLEFKFSFPSDSWEPKQYTAIILCFKWRLN